MKNRLRNVFTLAFSLFVSTSLFSQVGYTPTAGSSVAYTPAVGDTIYDPGGPGGSSTSNTPGNYPNCDCSTTITLNGVTEFRFDFFSVFADWDWVRVYDGATTSGTLLFDNGTSGNPFYDDIYRNDIIATQGNAVFSGSSGDMTLEFYATATVDYGGFAATITKLNTAPTCAPVTYVGVSNINTAGADIDWTAGGGETSWNIQYGPPGFNLGSGTTVSTSSNPHPLSGLAAGTDYEVWVQADCGSGDVSAYVGPVSFTTIPTCPDPSGLSSSNVTTNSVDLDWTENGSATTWNIEYGPPGFTPGTGTVVSTTNNPETLTGLLDNTDYDIYIQSDCGGSDLSNHVGPVSITTVSTCPAPSNLSASNTTNNSADLSWTNGGGETAWNIEYGPTGFTPGTGTVVSAGSNPYPLTGLTSGTTYQYYVQADCGSGDVSSYVGPFTFATDLDPFSCSSGSSYTAYSTDFEGGFPGDWTQINSSDPDWTYDGSGGTGSSNTGPSSAYSGSGFLYLETSSAAQGEADTLYLNTTIDLTTVVAEARATFFYHMYGGDMGTLYFEISDDNGATWNTEWSQVGQVQTDELDPWIGVDIDLSAYVGSQIQVRFIGEHGGSSYEGDMAIDLFEVETCISCPPPSNLVVNNTTGSTVELGWTAGGTETSWNIEYGPAGFTPGTGTVVNVTTNPATVPGLTPLTEYDFYVQADCGGSDQSSWTGPITVTTPIADLSCSTGSPYSLYLTDFEGGFPSDWTQVNSSDPDWTYDGSGGTGSTNTGPSGAHSGSGYLYLETSSAAQGEADTLYLNNAIDLTTVVGEARATFYYHMYGGDMGTLYFEVSDDNGATWNTEWSQVGQVQTDELDPWNGVDVDLTAYTGSQIQVRFVGEHGGTSYEGDMAIDLFEIEGCLSCPPPSSINISNITETTADVDWVVNGTETSWNIEYGPAGFTPGTGTVVSTSNNPETLTGLTDNTDYDVYVQADCGGGDLSTMEGPVSFSTDVYCLEPIAFQITDSTASTVDLQWIAQGTETSWDIVYGPAGFTPGSGAGTVETVSTNPYTVTGLQPGTVYDYYIQANCGQGQNNPYAGPLTQATPITNDAACNAIPVPVDGSTTQYTNEGATLETGELTSLGDNTIWFTFTAPADGHVEIKTCGNDFDNFIEVYEEPSDCGDFNTYTIVDAATDNPFATCSGTNDPAGLVLCGLTPGNTYYLAVGSESAGNTGIFPLTLTSIPDADAGTGTVTQVCSGDMVNLFGALSGNDNGGVWSEIDMTGGLEANGVYNTTNLAYIGYDVEYRVTNECSYDSTIVTVAISGPSQAGQDGTLTDCNVQTDFYLFDGLSGTVDFGGAWIDVDGTGKLNGSVFSPDSLAAGTYQFDYIVSNDVCPNDTSTVEVTITNCLSTEEFAAESFKIFPNPTNGIFYMVSAVNASNAIIEITDLQGKVISSEQMNINIGAQYDFNLSQLERGVYLIKVATQENTTVKRVVLQR